MYDKVCVACGTRLSEFYRTYMLGCPKCYASFEREITLAIKKIHGAVEHTGKIPATNGEDKRLLTEYQKLVREKENLAIDGKFSRIKEVSEDLLKLSEELKKRGLL